VYPLPGTQLSKRLDREKRLFPAARYSLVEGARDQVSAGLQFKPQRPVDDVLRDLMRVMHHAFDPELYFGRCADVAERLNTAPTFFPGIAPFIRNVRTFLRLCVAMTRSRNTRRPFWKALWRVVTRNPAGIEALATLSVLYVHFESMLPYVFGQLEQQRAEVQREGEEAWLARHLAEPEAPVEHKLRLA
jgi:hypothetical protein